MRNFKNWTIPLILVAALVGFGCTPPTTTNAPPPPPADADDPHAGHDHANSDPHGGADMGTGGMGAGGMGAGMGMQKKEYEIVVPEEVKEKYKAVDIRFGKREGGEPTTISVPVGESVKLGDSGLTLTVKAFLPAFYMDSARISSVTAELKNPAAKVTITEGDKELFDGWLFAKMPGVHPFEHPTWSVTLATGADAEAAQASAAQAKHAALDGHEGCDHAAAAPADNAECAHADAGFDHAGESPDGCCGGAKGKEAGHA